MKKLLFIIIILGIIQVYALDYETVIGSLDDSFEIKSAQLEIKKLEKDFISLTKPDDLSISLSPSMKSIDPESISFIDDIEITGTLSASIPLGLSKIEREKTIVASDAVVISKINAEKIQFSTFTKVYKLYKDLWILQTEENVLTLEVEAANENVVILNTRFNAGSDTLSNLNNAINLKQQRELNLSQNILQQKLMFYELMFTIGKKMEPENVEGINIRITDIPNPKELYTWISTNNPQVKIDKIKIAALIATRQRLGETDIDMSIKPFYNSPGNDISTSVNYNVFTKELSPSVTMNTGNSSDSWNTGITVNVSIGSNRSDKLEMDSLDLEIKQAEAELLFLIDNLNLKLRESYQKFLLNRELLLQSEINLKNSQIGHQLVLTKMELGQLSKNELLESNAYVSRSKWKVEAAIKEYELSWLSVLEDSAWYNNIDIEYE